MKDSENTEHRISNLKDMINNINEDENKEEEELEEDSELIDYLNENRTNYDDLEIDDEYIYHPSDEDGEVLNLDDAEINEDYIIKTPKTKDFDESDEFDDFNNDIAGEITDNIDNMLNAKIKGKPILGIASTIIGVIFIIISIVIFESRADRLIDNVSSGETNFIFIIFLIIGLLILIYGVFKLLNINNPFDNMTSSIESVEKSKKKETPEVKKEEPSEKIIPKSNIPLDKESYKIGEFKVEDLNTPNETSDFEEKINEEDTEEFKTISLDEEEASTVSEKENKKEEADSESDSDSIDDIFAEMDEMDKYKK